MLDDMVAQTQALRFHGTALSQMGYAAIPFCNSVYDPPGFSSCIKSYYKWTQKISLSTKNYYPMSLE